MADAHEFRARERKTADRKPAACPFCGHDGVFDGQGRRADDLHVKRRGVSSIFDVDWSQFRCPNCNGRFEMMTRVSDRAQRDDTETPDSNAGLLFVDQDADLVAELQASGVDAVQTADPIQDLEYDWIVSPANCHGYMDGGFDAYLAKRLGIDPVTGWRPSLDPAESVDMDEPFLELGDVRKWPEKNILIATTVRKPVAKTRRPVEVEHIKSCLDQLHQIAVDDDVRVLCPGLGTGFGGLSAGEFADLVVSLNVGSNIDDTSMEGSP
jgi:hypothetical protein